MSTFDFDKHKQDTIKRLEALEKIRLDFEAMKKKLSELDVGALIQQAAQTEIAKIMRYAKQHEIPFTIDVAELLAQVKIPAQPSVKGEKSQFLPFVPDTTESITDSNGNEWCWDNDDQEWVKNHWDSSGCEWASSQSC
jgi:hypothetical protein